MPRFERIKITCFGGGTGLPSLLSGLKKNPWFDVTAVVNMFDSGGSSGELKDRFGILPPGDILKCLLALSEDEAAARKILLKRISNRDKPGHTGGNVLLLALENVYGSYPDAIDALGQILSIRGSVIPVTFEHGSLCARYADGSVQKGEVNVDTAMWEGREIQELFLEPSVRASQSAIQAIERADVLCIGPGSFYTSVLPNFLPNGIRDAIAASRAPIIHIGNLLTEGMGMKGFTLSKIAAIVEQMIGRNISAVIANRNVPDPNSLGRYVQERKQPIAPDASDDLGGRLVLSDLWTDAAIARHDSERLAHEVFAVAHSLIERGSK